MSETKSEYTYRLDAPVQVLLQVRGNHAGLIRMETRPLRDRLVEVYETLGHGIRLFTAVGALIGRAVHERVVRADEGVAGTPLRMIVWDLA